MTGAMIRSAVLVFAVAGAPPAGAKDPEVPALLAATAAHALGTCEGFFTLKRPSLLVIGSEERLDAMIADGDVPDQDAVDRWDQERYAREREARARAFIAYPNFDGSRDIPPGLKLRVRGRVVYTASPGDQPERLQEALRDVTGPGRLTRWIAVDGEGRVTASPFDPRGHGRDLREVFFVRRADTIEPTDDDYAKLRGGLRATGVLVVRAGASYTMVVFE